jgi:uncharacterized protein (TIGR02266 family)
VVVRVRFANRRQLKQAFFRDISKGGMFLRTETPLAVHERVPLVLELPDGQTLELLSEVAHVVLPIGATPARPAGMAVRFLDFTSAKRNVIEDFLQRSKTHVPIGVETAPVPKLARTMTPAMPLPAMENLVRALRRLVWLCGDARPLADVDYYQILGLSPTATTDEIREACTVLRILLDPQAPPEGLADRLTPAQITRLTILGDTIAEIERTLTNAARRAQYDAARFGIIR